MRTSNPITNVVFVLNNSAFVSSKLNIKPLVGLLLNPRSTLCASDASCGIKFHVRFKSLHRRVIYSSTLAAQRFLCKLVFIKDLEEICSHLRSLEIDECVSEIDVHFLRKRQVHKVALVACRLDLLSDAIKCVLSWDVADHDSGVAAAVDLVFGNKVFELSPRLFNVARLRLDNGLLRLRSHNGTRWGKQIDSLAVDAFHG